MKWARGDTLGQRKSVVESQANYFNEFGALGIKDLFPRKLIQNLNDYVAKEIESGALAKKSGRKKVGEKRDILNLPLEGPIHNPVLYANPGILRLMKELLGEHFIIGNIGVVLALPQSPKQHIHRDQYHLFQEEKNARFLASIPPYCINFAIPLIDFNSKTGSTRIWPGTHRLPDEVFKKPEPGALPQIENTGIPPQLKNCRSEIIYPRQGSCYLFNYLVYHGGTRNESNRARPLLYIVYQRPWFRDRNFTHIPFSKLGSKEEIKKVPPEFRHLFASHSDKR